MNINITKSCRYRLKSLAIFIRNVVVLIVCSSYFWLLYSTTTLLFIYDVGYTMKLIWVLFLKGQNHVDRVTSYVWFNWISYDPNGKLNYRILFTTVYFSPILIFVLLPSVTVYLYPRCWHLTYGCTQQLTFRTFMGGVVHVRNYKFCRSKCSTKFIDTLHK